MSKRRLLWVVTTMMMILPPMMIHPSLPLKVARTARAAAAAAAAPLERRKGLRRLLRLHQKNQSMRSPVNSPTWEGMAELLLLLLLWAWSQLLDFLLPLLTSLAAMGAVAVMGAAVAPRVHRRSLLPRVAVK
jgi:hypothetical protein